MHVQYRQLHEGDTCKEAIAHVARPPPEDCGCICNPVEACDFKLDKKMYDSMYLDYQVIKGRGSADSIYINNCKFGLHGPIEVLSQQALTDFVQGLTTCSNLLVHPW